jgi:hypothetical protein
MPTPIAVERFEEFHAQNPAVYDYPARLAGEWIRRTGTKRCSIYTLFERARWELAIETSDPNYRQNNTWIPFYYRLLARREEELGTVFELRPS